MTTTKPKIALGMSGGIDSSVSALILKEQGYDVVGFFLKFWYDPSCEGKAENRCCDDQSLFDAIKVCQKIGIKLQIVDMRKKFKQEITDDFLTEYKNHKTPNPCVICNQKIKFGHFLELAESLNFDYAATGHYAKIKKIGDEFHLFEANDETKDQSYFLYRLNQKQLSKVVFPLSEMKKSEVKKIAKKNQLFSHEKKESQEICFVGDDLNKFLQRNLTGNGFQSGDIIDTEDKIIGAHKGLNYYTIGQRKGVDQSFLKSDVDKSALFVVGFNYKKNQLIVGPKSLCEKSEITISDLKFILPKFAENIEKLKNLSCRVRYHGQKVAIKSIKKVGDNLEIELKKPVFAPTPGQSLVIYDDDEILGGGIIS